MESKPLDKLFKKAFGNILVFLLERSWRSILAWIFIILFAPPLVEYIHSILKSIPYLNLVTTLWLFLSKIFTLKDLSYLVIIVCVVIWLRYITQKQWKLTTIEENFEDKLRRWSVPLNSHWLIEKTSDRSTQSLCLYSSSIPGLLKPAYNWYDYVFTFSAKFTTELNIVVRATSSSNGIMLKVTTDKITPYIICEGEYIKDDKKIEELPVLFKPREWIDISVTVEGNFINVKTSDINIRYKIPSVNLRVEESDLWIYEPSLSALETKNKEIDTTFNKWMDLWEKEGNEADPTKKGELTKQRKEASKHYSSFKIKTLVLDYQTGSVGFRNNTKDMVFVNNIKLKQL